MKIKWIVLLCFQLIGCMPKPGMDIGTTPDSDWWMYQENLYHTGYLPTENLIPPLKLKWFAELTTQSVQISPAVFGREHVFVATGNPDARIYALSKNDGSIIWTFPMPRHEIEGGLLAANGRVYFVSRGPSTEKNVHALDASSGQMIWLTTLEGGSRTAMAAAYGTLYTNTNAHMLYALDQATGEVRWTSATSPGQSTEESSPAVGFFKVLVGSDDGLYAFDAATGQLKWKYTAGAVGYSSPVVQTHVAQGKPVIVLFYADMKIHALSVSDGRRVWVYPGSGLGGNVGLGNGKVILFEWDDVVAVESNNGNVIWRSSLGVYPRDAPATTAFHTFVRTDLDQIRALRLSDGVEEWSFAIPGNGNPSSGGNAPALVEDMLVVPNKGYLYAFDQEH